MKKLKSFISVILVAAFLASLNMISIEAYAVVTAPTFIVGNVSAECGAKGVEVTVSVMNNPGIASAALDIIYDSDALTLTDFSYNTEALNGTSTTPYNASAKPPCLFMVNGTENITGDFDIATLFFDVADTASGNYNITLKYDEENVYNIDEENISFNILSGTVTVSNNKASDTDIQTDSEEIDDTSPTFVVESVLAKKGAKNVAVTVSFKNNPGIASAALDIVYDDKMLTLKNFTYNTPELEGASTTQFNANAKPPCLYMVNGTANVTGDILFATLYFDVADEAEGSCDITLKYDEDNVYDLNENNIYFNIKKGVLTVTPEEQSDIDSKTCTYYFLAPESWFKKDKGALNENIGFYAWTSGEGSYSNADYPGVKMTPAPEVGENVFKVEVENPGFECGLFNDFVGNDVDPAPTWIYLSQNVYFDGYIEGECDYDSTLTCDSFDGWIFVLNLDTPNTQSQYTGVVYCPGAWFTLDDYKNYKEYYGTYPEHKETSDEPEPNAIYGDLDGDEDITSADALSILRISAELEVISPEMFAIADVDADEDITSADALAVLRYSTGMEDEGSIINTSIYAKNTFYK